MVKCNNKCPKGEVDVCCNFCSQNEICDDVCEASHDSCGCAVVEDEQSLAEFKSQQLTVLENIVKVVNMKKQCEEQEKALKDQLKQAMEKYGVKKFESDLLNITYIAETTSTSIDSAKLKKLHPDIAEECSKTSKKSAYIKVEVKGGKSK